VLLLAHGEPAIEHWHPSIPASGTASHR